MATTSANDTAQNASNLPEISTSPIEANSVPQTSPAEGESIPNAPEQSTAANAPSESQTTSAIPSTETVEPTEEPAALSTSAPLSIKSVRKYSEALGPATEAPIVTPAPGITALTITLQLTTGARHPYKIDERYLTSRKVEAKNGNGDFEPLELSGYKLKELIWTDWRTEWEPRPASPSSIRLIYLGKLLEDKKALKEYALALDTPNIIHMTVKPADFDDDETAGKGGKSSSLRHRDGEEPTAGCRCVIL